MAECGYCDESVAMPYRCSLCQERHCGKHRLPEQHECNEIQNFQSGTYAKTRINKTREMQQIKSGQNSPSSFQMMQMENSPLGKVWTAPTQIQTLLLAGLLLGFISSVRDFDLGISFVASMLVFTVLGMGLVFLFRSQKATDLAIRTEFVFWPIGVAIAAVLSLLGLIFHLFGFFQNSRASHKDEANLAKYSTYTFAGLFISSQIFVFIFSVLFPDLLPPIMVYALDVSSSQILWLGALQMIPIGFFDGVKLYHYNRTSYWKHAALLIALVIVSIF